MKIKVTLSLPEVGAKISNNGFAVKRHLFELKVFLDKRDHLVFLKRFLKF